MSKRKKRRSSSLLLEDKQYIDDLWIENWSPSSDFQNGRDIVKMRYNKYERRYANLNNDKHPAQQKIKVYVASCRVATCTIRKLRSKIMSDKGISLSNGLLSHLKPFYITNPTDKEKVMCMGKLRLNLCLKFNALMTHSKNFNGPHFDLSPHITWVHGSVLKVRIVTGLSDVLKESAKIVVTLNHLNFGTWKMKDALHCS